MINSAEIIIFYLYHRLNFNNQHTDDESVWHQQGTGYTFTKGRLYLFFELVFH